MCISVYSVLSYYTCNSCDINGGQQLMGNSLSGSLPYSINIIDLHWFIYCYVTVNKFLSLSLTPRSVAVLSNSTTKLISWSWVTVSLAICCWVPNHISWVFSACNLCTICCTPSINLDLQHMQLVKLQHSAIQVLSHWYAAANHQRSSGRTIQMMQWCRKPYVQGGSKGSQIFRKVSIWNQIGHILNQISRKWLILFQMLLFFSRKNVFEETNVLQFIECNGETCIWSVHH